MIRSNYKKIFQLAELGCHFTASQTELRTYYKGTRLPFTFRFHENNDSMVIVDLEKEGYPVYVVRTDANKRRD